MEKMVAVLKCLVLQRVRRQWAADGCMVLHVAWQCWRWWESAAAWCSFSTMSWSYYQMQWMEPAACQPPTLSPADILFWIWLWALTQAGDDIIVKLRVGSQKTRAGLRYSNHYPASIKTQVRNLTSSDSLCILHLRTLITTNSEVEEKNICCFYFWFSLVNAEPRTLGLSSISIYVKKFNPNHVQTNADKICWKTSSTFPTKFN